MPWPFPVPRNRKYKPIDLLKTISKYKTEHWAISQKFQNYFILSFHVYVYLCGYVHVSTVAQRGQNRALNPLKLEYKWLQAAQYGGWEWSVHPLQVLCALLTTEESLQHPRSLKHEKIPYMNKCHKMDLDNSSENYKKEQYV